ncbi:hypothetical protein BO99DRAFT_142192 [Aspergillus violaceofuscus CBS 115571]|uniref:Uncharacterized protein n=1 Tax=Aspergillus violaceofuscus (strain CBS 115571) TaxID=1450538 RepID=A0A2V5H5D8_ASPV1|nr:hypothetical protein BO99DRAFT_142192 [Aspergillus violaceofuscus CBS 115571]
MAATTETLDWPNISKIPPFFFKSHVPFFLHIFTCYARFYPLDVPFFLSFLSTYFLRIPCTLYFPLIIDRNDTICCIVFLRPSSGQSGRAHWLDFWCSVCHSGSWMRRASCYQTKKKKRKKKSRLIIKHPGNLVFSRRLITSFISGYL